MAAIQILPGHSVTHNGLEFPAGIYIDEGPQANIGSVTLKYFLKAFGPKSEFKVVAPWEPPAVPAQPVPVAKVNDADKEFADELSGNTSQPKPTPAVPLAPVMPPTAPPPAEAPVPIDPKAKKSK